MPAPDRPPGRRFCDPITPPNQNCYHRNHKSLRLKVGCAAPQPGAVPAPHITQSAQGSARDHLKRSSGPNAAARTKVHFTSLTPLETRRDLPQPRPDVYAPPMDARETLENRLTELDAEDAAGAQGQQTVMLDQQAVGRLSRMDALQNQAMAHAQARNRQIERQRIHAALKRLDAGEYGYCTDCGEEISPKRLEADPTIPRCLDCTRGG